MAKLSFSQLVELAGKAGFTGQDQYIAMAVAMAESGGETTKHNTKPPDNSYGLWQINMYGDMGPDRRKRFGITTNDQLFDPNINAKAAYIIFKSQGWERGWTTYKNGAYKKFMTPEVAEPIIGDPVKDVPAAINKFGETLFKGVSNIAGIGVALGLLAVGVTFLIMSSKSAQKAVSIAANVVPGGNVVKGAVKKVAKA